MKPAHFHWFEFLKYACFESQNDGEHQTQPVVWCFIDEYPL